MAKWPANDTKVDEGIEKKEPTLIVDGLLEKYTDESGRFGTDEWGKILMAVYLEDIKHRLRGSTGEYKLDEVADLLLPFETNGGFEIPPDQLSAFKSTLSDWIKQSIPE
ncbi:MAG: hypothetical protein ACD_28C00112G0004 [uncultured bacterium]|nr:MAG: hypothetical protein ACD_28C00112G0004 [uncultured bacterium]KKT74347.1 MAG: hypothetical protein UW70_C0058G0005 [Candidatus Peregrinibacteria bacterium GW2011_GWA2_44_7]